MKKNKPLQKNLKEFLTFFVLILSLNSYSQTLVFEDFESAIGTTPTSGYIVRSETTATNTTSSNASEFNLNRSDFVTAADCFGRVSTTEVNNASPSIILSNIQGNRFFYAGDTDQTGNPNGSSFDEPSINWFNINVSSISNIKVSAFFAESDGASNSWDADHSLRIEYSFNNTNWTPVLAVESENSTTNQIPRIDTNFDNTGDGAEVTGTLTEYTSLDIDVSSANTISFRVSFKNFTSGEENVVLDNFKVEVAAPADSTPPTVNSIAVNGSPATNATSVGYSVTFSEAVTGVDTSDFTIDGSGVTGNITGISGSGANYTVTVSSVSGTGTLSIDLKSSGTDIIDAASNAISGGFTNGANHTVDTVQPTVNSITVNSSPATNATSVSYTVTFSEAVTGVDTSDFTIDGSGVTGNITGISGSGANYIVTVSSVSGTGTLSIDLKSSGTNIIDAASNAINGGFTAGANHTVDTIAPTLSASNPTDNATNISLNQDITLTFSENISKGTGNIIIKKRSDDSILETINVTSAAVTINTNVATINPSVDFDLNTEYYIQIDNTAFKDASDNNYAGISATTTLSFTTLANQTNTFSSSGNWSDTSKWSLGRLPINTDNIEIGFGVTVLLNISNAIVNDLSINSGTLNIDAGNALTLEGNLTQNGSFNMLSNANSNSSLIVKGTSTGNVTYLRYLTTNWHLVASPVNGQSINSLSSEVNTNNENYAIAPYQNNVVALERWNYFTTPSGTNNIANAGNFEKAKGYSIQKKTIAGTVTFSGTLNTNNAGETISITDGGDNPLGNRWNLIGNPYISAISASNAADATNNFLKVNIDAGNLDPTQAGLYLWTGATPYEVKSIDDAAFYIAPGQAFFVHAPDSGGTSVSFTEAMQTHQTGDVFLKNNISYPEIVLQMSDGKSNTSTKIRYIENKTTGLDIGSDVGTFTGFGSNFGVYTQLINNNEGVNFAIQALPNNDYENMVIPIGINGNAEQEITFSLSANNFDADMNLFLEDRFTKTFTKLNEANSHYKITLSEKTNGIGRFYLHTTNKSVLNIDENLALEDISIYKANNSTLKIIGLQSDNARIDLVTTLGKQVFTTSFKSNGTADISLPKLPKGVYIIQLKTTEGNLSKKIILE